MPPEPDSVGPDGADPDGVEGDGGTDPFEGSLVGAVEVAAGVVAVAAVAGFGASVPASAGLAAVAGAGFGAALAGVSGLGGSLAGSIGLPAAGDVASVPDVPVMALFTALALSLVWALSSFLVGSVIPPSLNFGTEHSL